MNSNSQIKHLFISILFLAIVPGIILFLLPYILVSLRQTPLYFPRLQYLAVVFWLPGICILLWSVKEFIYRGKGTPSPTNPPQEFVVQGFYRYVRNPMYLGALLILTGHFIWFQRGWLLLYIGFLFAHFHRLIIRYEEPELVDKFGESYLQYQKTVPRWVPRLTRVA